MGPAVYILGALTSLWCAVLLSSGYRRVGQRLLLWSGLCFAGLALSNVLLFLDLVIFPGLDLHLLRLITAAIATGLLLYGLIWERR